MQEQVEMPYYDFEQARFVYPESGVMYLRQAAEQEGIDRLFRGVVGILPEHRVRHSYRVVDVGDIILELLGRGDERPVYRTAALLHDVGKLAVPSRILDKPGPYTPQERVISNEHVMHGWLFLGQVNSLITPPGNELVETAARIAFEHHERYDGNGYLRGMKGDEIFWLAMVAAAADSLDAAVMQRVYNIPMPVPNALADITGNGKFHPDIREALSGNPERFEAYYTTQIGALR